MVVGAARGACALIFVGVQEESDSNKKPIAKSLAEDMRR